MVLRKAIDSGENMRASMAVCAPYCLWFDQNNTLPSKPPRTDFREILSLDIASVAFQNVYTSIDSLLRCFSGLRELSLKSLRFLEAPGDNTTIRTRLPDCCLERVKMSNDSVLVSKHGSHDSFNGHVLTRHGQARDVHHCARALQLILSRAQRTLQHLTLDTTTMAALRVTEDRRVTYTRTQRPTPPAELPLIFDLSCLSNLCIEVRIAARPDAVVNKELANASRLLPSLLSSSLWRSSPRNVIAQMKIYPEEPGGSGALSWPTRLREGFAALDGAFRRLSNTVLRSLRIRIVRGGAFQVEAIREMRVIFPDAEVSSDTLA